VGFSLGAIAAPAVEHMLARGLHAQWTVLAYGGIAVVPT
jgi:hypothetical protein